MRGRGGVGAFRRAGAGFVDVSVAQMLLLIFVVLFIQIRPQGVVSVKSRALDA
jgi:urea transport system permease protein